jgi:putative ABC transport system permease protein
VLGAIAVAAAIQQYAQQRLTTLAIMRTLGARSGQIAGVFFLQIGWMIAAAIAVAVPLAIAIRMSILSLAGNYLTLPSSAGIAQGFDYLAVIGSMGAGLASLAPALARPAHYLLHFRPAMVLRSDAESGTLAFPIVRTASGWISAGIACIAFGALAARMFQSWNSAILMVAALVITALLASLLGTAAISLAKTRLPRRLRGAPLLRCGLTSMHRESNRSRTIVGTLAVAFTVMVATFEAGGAAARAAAEVVSYDRNSLYVAGFKETARGKMRAFLEAQPGVESVNILSQARLNVRDADGPVPGMPHFAVCDPAPQGGGIGPPKLVMADDIARHIGANIGSRFDLDTGTRIIHATLTEIRKLTPSERIWSTIELDCSGIEESSLFHYAAARTRPGATSVVRREILNAYPTLAVITPEELDQMIIRTSHDAMLLLRVVIWCAIGSGLCVLVAMVSASQAARLHEIGVLSSLGARPRTIFMIYTIEFAALGILAGTIAALLACGFASVVLSIIFQTMEWVIEWKAVAITILGSTILTITGGWLPVYGLLRRRPMDVLRAG